MPIIMASRKGLILAAGQGKRMGEIGTVVPKVLWPIFDKTILELQILYLRELGVEEIFMNTHHLSKTIEAFVEKKKLNVNLMHEKVCLGTGGPLHRFKKEVAEDRILVFNGDQFYFDPALESWYEVYGTTLFGMMTQGTYNKFFVEDGRLTSIGPACHGKSYLSFSGVSVVDLKKIDYKEGASEYFDTVVNWEKEEIFVEGGEKSIYYDFGSRDRYVTSMGRILNGFNMGLQDPFLAFLRRNEAIDPSEIRGFSYRANGEGQMMLANGFSLSKKEITFMGLTEALKTGERL